MVGGGGEGSHLAVAWKAWNPESNEHYSFRSVVDTYHT